MYRNVNLRLPLIYFVFVALAFSFASCHHEPIVLNPSVTLNIELLKNKTKEVSSKSAVVTFDASVKIVYETDTTEYICTFVEKEDDIYILDYTRSNIMHVALRKAFHVEVSANYDGEVLFGKSGELIAENENEAIIVVIELGANGYDYVDLGLPSRMLWATCNLGANSPEEYGNYYAWAETETKNTYVIGNYNYNSGIETIDASHDAATINMGGNWHIPTLDDFEELITNCTWTWTSMNEVDGCLLTGPNGNSMFLPAAGGMGGEEVHNDKTCGIYWLNSIFPNDTEYAWGILSDADTIKRTSYCRYYGQTIRPACNRNRQ